jgi:hypothetical protein
VINSKFILGSGQTPAEKFNRARDSIRFCRFDAATRGRSARRCGALGMTMRFTAPFLLTLNDLPR